MKRIKENNDPAAMRLLGTKLYSEGDYDTAVEYMTKAAELGDTEAHYGLAVLYRNGECVEMDEKKQVYHLEEAAIGGHPYARYDLGCIEARNGRYERARKHFITAANLGHHPSLSQVKRLYAEGHASKEDYADALRAYQAAIDATKSEQREEAEQIYQDSL
jgi:TPR repeat protein